ncbi:hypothetical protein IC582_028777 [Cucumis melo]
MKRRNQTRVLSPKLCYVKTVFFSNFPLSIWNLNSFQIHLFFYILHSDLNFSRLHSTQAQPNILHHLAIDTPYRVFLRNAVVSPRNHLSQRRLAGRHSQNLT